MSFVPLNPRPLLQSLINDDVTIRLKWNETEYTGKLVSVDSYMNLQLSGAEEYVGGKHQGGLGMVFIRYVNFYTGLEERLRRGFGRSKNSWRGQRAGDHGNQA
ncbi:putative small nuclear ribonucleoprotein F [Cryoendolithus antarcticus]|uniref:Sm protein F n=1 Tax=Cryoendolithus antarcticus TaxID=1507870 RepID=A0A1V8SMD9_9PEZI|nr:putative small nuclear ribonucleoprotein F [Cryoendolithus antarcticus]